MESSRAALALWSVLLVISALRAWAEGRVLPCGLCEVVRGPPLVVPELATDGAERLAWLPGLGTGRATRVVRERPWLGTPLSVETIALLPGIGEVTQRDARTALARWAELKAARGSKAAAQR